MLRALLPVHKNRVLKGRSWFILVQLTALVWLVSLFSVFAQLLHKPGRASRFNAFP